MEKTNKIRRGTIKTRLIVIPLIVVFLVIVSIGFFSSYFLRASLLDELETSGTYLVKQIVKNTQDNYRALATINGIMDEKIQSSARIIVDGYDSISNEFLKTMADHFDVEEISWYNPEGRIINSNLEDNIGWIADSGHIIQEFIQSGDRDMIEDIRKDNISGNYFKFGYLKAPNGDFVQIGINANRIQELTEAFDHQKFLEDISQDEEIEYALFLDTKGQVIAHVNKEEIGMIIDDEGSISAAINGVPFVQEWYYEESGVEVLDISYPTIMDGHHTGAISVGLSLDNITKTIERNILLIIGITIIAFIALGLILYNASRYVVTITRRLKEQVQHMEVGDLSVDMEEDLLNKNDELGEIAQAIHVMQEAMKSIIKSVIDTTQNLAASSQELTATSQQSAMAADEVARAIEEIASGATEQAKDTESGVISISGLGDLVIENEEYIDYLNKATQKVTDLKDQGLEMLKTLVEKTDISSRSSKEVQEVIITSNASAEKISNSSEMIKNIADQTNLLALNAAIEAARAGEAGRGFAVVAEEIRKLAEESNRFAEEINKVVNELTDQTSRAVNTMNELEDIVLSQTESVGATNNKFLGIANSLETMENIITKVNNSSREMTAKKEEVIKVMENLSAISEENAAGTEEASASVQEQTSAMEEIANSSEQLAHMAEDLSRQVGRFTI